MDDEVRPSSADLGDIDEGPVTSFLERPVQWLERGLGWVLRKFGLRPVRVSYLTAWLIFCAPLFLAYVYIVGPIHAQAAAAPRFVAGLLLIPGIWASAAAVIRASKLLNGFGRLLPRLVPDGKTCVLEVYGRKLKQLFDWRLMIATGALFTVLFVEVVIMLWCKGYVASWITLGERTGHVVLIWWFILALGAFFAGVMLHCLVGAGSLIADVGRRVVAGGDELPSSTTMAAFGTVLLRITLGAVGVFALGLLPFIAGYQPVPVIWPIACGVFLAGYAILSQSGVHHAMVEAKRARVRELSPLLADARRKLCREPCSGNIDRMTKLLQIQRELEGAREWPFDTKVLLMFLGSVAIPILLAILSLRSKSG